jgi:hypothetical protein
MNANTPLPPFITIKNPNPARYGNWKTMKVGLNIQYMHDVPVNKWFVSYTTRGEIGTILLATGRTMLSAMNNLEIKLKDWKKLNET